MTESWRGWNTPIFDPDLFGFGCTTNTSCTDLPPNDDATCVINSRNWGIPIWYYNASYYATNYSSAPAFDGDFYVDEIDWVDSNILGCIYPYRQSNVTIVMYPDETLRIRFGQGKHCEIFPYTIVGRPRATNLPLPPGFKPNCNYTLNPSNVYVTYYADNWVEFHAPASSWDCFCKQVETGGYGSPNSNNTTLWALIFGIVSGVLLIAAILGIIFGVRRHKQRQQKQKLDEKKDAQEATSERR